MTENEMKEIVLKRIIYNFNEAVEFSKKFYEAPIGEGENFRQIGQELFERCLEANCIFSELFGHCAIPDITLIHKFVYREELE